MRKRIKNKICFTLLEVMVGISLLIMISSLVGWNLYRSIQKKHFFSDVAKIESQLQSCHRLALNTQLDWKLEMTTQGKFLTVRSFAIHGCPIRLKPIQTDSLSILFEGKEIEEMSLYISPTGKVEPEGIFICISKSGDVEKTFSTHELFGQKQLPAKEGPADG